MVGRGRRPAGEETALLIAAQMSRDNTPLDKGKSAIEALLQHGKKQKSRPRATGNAVQYVRLRHFGPHKE